MGILGVQLTWVVVKNLEQSVEFYTKTLGFTLKEHRPEFGWAELEGKTGSRLGLAQEHEGDIEYGPHVKAGSNGVVTITVENLDATTEEYAAKGVRLLGKVLEIPGEVKMRTFQDLDGNLFQIVEMLI